MAKRVLKVCLQSRATADGRERLARAVSWVIERAPSKHVDRGEHDESIDERIELFLDQGNR